MSTTRAIATIVATRGETIVWGLRADPVYVGAETVTCAIKLAEKGIFVPDESVAAVLNVTPVFVPTAGLVLAYWSFSVTAAQSATLPSDVYITDAKVISGGAVDYPAPLLINLAARVTA